MEVEVDANQIRRVVTGHDENGRAVVTDDRLWETAPTPAGTSSLTVLWTSIGLPVDNDDPTDGRDRQVGLTLPGGSVMRIVDLVPGTTSPMHRTSSLDYGVVLSGTAELLLDDDSVTRFETGEVVVQRGTIHAWRNPSTDTVARMLFILLAATPATVDGVPLPALFPGGAVTP